MSEPAPKLEKPTQRLSVRAILKGWRVPMIAPKPKGKPK